MARGHKTGGRKAGTPNKLTASIKEAITEAFYESGGKNYLIGLAVSNPQVFCALLGKIIPTEVVGEGEGPVKLMVEWSNSPGS